VYGVSADRLEEEWSVQLAAFTAGGYLQQNVPVFDSAQAEALIGRGEYDAALAELDTLRAGLEAGAPELATVDALLNRAKDGQRALQLAADSKQALANGQYETAKSAAAEAQPLLQALGQPAQADVMGEYVALADEGLRAQQQLAAAREALRTLRVGTARTALIDAYTSFTRLGDVDGAAAAERTLTTIERTQWLFVLGLLLLAAITVGWNVHRRVSERTPVVPWG
jgi:multidrug efflux pump subunit AcrA (membrane-fusion protein)